MSCHSRVLRVDLPLLTIVILTANEEKRISRCIKSLAHRKLKVVIIDSFSKDQTRRKAQKAWEEAGQSLDNLAFIEREWKGFTEARNFSLSWVNTPWVLWLDADEWIEKDLDEALDKLNELDSDIDVFKISRQSYFLGKAIKFGGWYPDRKARLGRVGQCEWRKGPRGADVHEDLFSIKDTPRLNISGHIGHEPFLDLQEQYDTNWRYSSLLAEGLAGEYRLGKKRPKTFLEVGIKVLIKFFENYILKLGILDGKPGFIIARGSALSLWWRLNKAKQLYKGTLGS